MTAETGVSASAEVKREMSDSPGENSGWYSHVGSDGTRGKWKSRGKVHGWNSLREAGCMSIPAWRKNLAWTIERVCEMAG